MMAQVCAKKQDRQGGKRMERRWRFKRKEPAPTSGSTDPTSQSARNSRQAEWKTECNNTKTRDVYEGWGARPGLPTCRARVIDMLSHPLRPSIDSAKLLWGRIGLCTPPRSPVHQRDIGLGADSGPLQLSSLPARYYVHTPSSPSSPSYECHTDLLLRSINQS